MKVIIKEEKERNTNMKRIKRRAILTSHEKAKHKLIDF